MSENIVNYILAGAAVIIVILGAITLFKTIKEDMSQKPDDTLSSPSRFGGKEGKQK